MYRQKKWVQKIKMYISTGLRRHIKFSEHNGLALN